MKRLSALALAGVITLALSGRGHAKEIYATGDSLCVGLAQAAKLKSVARVGAHTREVVSQLKRIPKGATVIVCAGTNDAAAKLHGFSQAVDAALAEAKRRKQNIIWIGPINTTLWWEPWSDKADTLLALRVPRYVSLRAVGWRRGERAGDRIHLITKGSLRLWRIIKEKLK
jgi:hypothetical protein